VHQYKRDNQSESVNWVYTKQTNQHKTELLLYGTPQIITVNIATYVRH